MEKCRNGFVPDFSVEGDPGHTAKCWLHDKSEESEKKLVNAGIKFER
jgi:hypothetical protein